MTYSAEKDAGRANPFLRIEDTTWPSPLDPNETAWRLIYGQPSKKDLMFAASVMSAYGYLFEMSQRDRNRRMSQIKSAVLPPVETVPIECDRGPCWKGAGHDGPCAPARILPPGVGDTDA